MGKIETFDKNRDLKETHSAKKKSLQRPGPLNRDPSNQSENSTQNRPRLQWGPQTFKMGTSDFQNRDPMLLK